MVPIPVKIGEQSCRVGDALTYHGELVASLHGQDRVHTYGSFHIAGLATVWACAPRVACGPESETALSMSVLSEIKVLYHMALSPIRGATHAERLESFYGGQAKAYDGFRGHLLKGRKELWEQIPVQDGAVWVDMGGGTGSNLERIGPAISTLSKVYVVDLCPSLLDVARGRAQANGWTNVEAVESDVTAFTPSEGAADVVTFSYSLTMIPNWFAAIDRAREILRPGGLIGVVDFHVSQKYPAPGHDRHSWFTRTFWPAWLSMDNVHPSPDHIPYLFERFSPVHFSEHRNRLRYLPMARAPYFLFVGRSP